MKYVRGSTLLPCASEMIRSVPRVPYQRLGADNLLIYDARVSDFFFEFGPEEDMQRFLLHAHFACRTKEGLRACREDLHSLIPFLEREKEPPPLELVFPPEGDELPSPLRFVAQQSALDTIRREGRWRGTITCCSCGIAGCFSQYAWIERGVCLFLFTINGAALAEVECLSFHVAPG